MIYHSISDYLVAKNIYEQTPIRILPNGKVFSFIEGDWKEGCDFDKPHYEHLNKDNPDKSNLNIGVIPHKTR